MSVGKRANFDIIQYQIHRVDRQQISIIDYVRQMTYIPNMVKIDPQRIAGVKYKVL